MRTDFSSKQLKSSSLWYFSMGAILLWSFFIGAITTWNYRNEKAATYKAAEIHADTAIEKDVLFRKWNAGHGGVYVQITETTKPNPYLKIDEREITTPSGKMLTKINPAFMTRQIHELAMKHSGVRGHITSLKPIRPKNAPNKWEIKALQAFENGAPQMSSIERRDGKEYLRLMRPLITEPSCLQCHEKQGYKVGDIRGGISVTVPLSPYLEIESANIITLFIINGMIWLIGVAGIGTGMFFLSRQIQRRIQAEQDLRHREKLQSIIEMSGAICHELNQPLQAISGNAELLLLTVGEDNPYYKKIKNIQIQAERIGEITKKLMGLTSYETKSYLEDAIIDLDKSSQ